MLSKPMTAFQGSRTEDFRHRHDSPSDSVIQYFWLTKRCAGTGTLDFESDSSP